MQVTPCMCACVPVCMWWCTDDWQSALLSSGVQWQQFLPVLFPESVQSLARLEGRHGQSLVDRRARDARRFFNKCCNLS